MGSIYPNLKNILESAGIRVVTEPGWETRSRSSGGFDQNPLAVYWHHTASSTSPANDVSFMCYGADAAPVANLLIGRDGVAYVMAAGATNTNGSGNQRGYSRGTVPSDGANSRVIGMEIANNGVGEAYTTPQINTAFAASNALNAAFGNRASDVDTHNAYAPNRKIDPATAQAANAGGFIVRSINSSGTWNLEDLIDECNARDSSGGGSVPKPGGGYNPTSNWGLFPLDTSKPWVGPGDDGELDRGDHVWYVQDVIHFYAGGNIPRTGVFDAQTKKRVIDLQRLFGMKQTGSVNNGGQYADDTWQALDDLVELNTSNPPEPPPPYNPPSSWGLYPVDGNKPWIGQAGSGAPVSSGQHVTYCQDVMKAYSDSSMIVDGQFGSQTAAGVRNLQNLFGLDVTGSVNHGGQYASNTWRDAIDFLVNLNS